MFRSVWAYVAQWVVPNELKKKKKSKLSNQSAYYSLRQIISAPGYQYFHKYLYSR